jgi:hypothetical protein
LGLGDGKTVDLTIRWPNGLTEKIPNVEADHLVIVREGSGIERRQKFAPREVAFAVRHPSGRRLD